MLAEALRLLRTRQRLTQAAVSRLDERAQVMPDTTSRARAGSHPLMDRWPAW